MRTIWVAALLFLLAPLRGAAQAPTEPTAAELFDRGTALYAKGRYAEAIAVFSAAQRLEPHPVALFSIARCHENLGHLDRALDYFRLALAATPDPAKQAEIRARIEDLERRPVKVFVSSRPLGARVTVAGRLRPEPGRTPLVLALPPGVHVLLVELEGHALAAHRLKVEIGKDVPVAVPLSRLPASGPCLRPVVEAQPSFRHDDGRPWHLRLSVLGLAALASSRPFAVGAGVQAHGAYRRLVFGGQFQAHTMATRDITPRSTGDRQEYDRNAISRLLFQVETGWMIPLRTAYLYGTLGLGFAYERQKFAGWDRRATTPAPLDEVQEDLGFAWSLGGGIEAMVTSWLSIGSSLRAGMIHGPRTDIDDPRRRDDSENVPFGTLSASATFHL